MSERRSPFEVKCPKCGHKKHKLSYGHGKIASLGEVVEIFSVKCETCGYEFETTLQGTVVKLAEGAGVTLGKPMRPCCPTCGAVWDD